MSIVYCQGRFQHADRATIPLLDRGFLYGDGIFTTLKVTEGQPLYFEENSVKLQEQAERFNLILPPIPKSLIEELIQRNGVNQARLKIIVTGGQGSSLGLPKRRGELILMVGPLPEIRELTATPLQLPLFPGKTLSLLPRLYLAELAQPYDEAILLDEKGHLLETAFGNLFWSVEGALFTPDPTKLPLYFGVTMEKMCQEKRVQFACTLLCDLPREAQLFRANALGISPLIVS